MPEADLENTNEVPTALEAYEQALQAYQSALQVYQEIGDRPREANLQSKLGNVLRRKDLILYPTNPSIPLPPPMPRPSPRPRDLEDALSAYQKALVIYQEEGMLLEKASVLTTIGDTYFREGIRTSHLNSF